jgi:hypothetical protein
MVTSEFLFQGDQISENTRTSLPQPPERFKTAELGWGLDNFLKTGMSAYKSYLNCFWQEG